MGFEHVFRQGIAEFLIAIVEGDAKAVFGEIWQGLVYRECGKDQGIADFVVRAVPLAFQFVGVDAQAARAQGEVVFHDRIDFVRAGQYGEATQFNGAVANRCPAGVGVEVALKVYKVLVNRRGVRRVFGKPQASDFVRMRENRTVHHFFEQVEHFWFMGNAVKGFEFVHFVIHVGVFGIAFGTLFGYIGNAIYGIGSFDEPGCHSVEHLPPQIPEFVRILQFAEEEIPFFTDAPPQFFRIFNRVVGYAKFCNLVRHGLLLGWRGDLGDFSLGRSYYCLMHNIRPMMPESNPN